MSNSPAVLIAILLQLGLPAVRCGIIRAVVKVWTYCFGYSDQFWELALFAVVAGVIRVHYTLKLWWN